jgi:hypothetical protein
LWRVKRRPVWHLVDAVLWCQPLRG